MVGSVLVAGLTVTRRALRGVFVHLGRFEFFHVFRGIFIEFLFAFLAAKLDFLPLVSDDEGLAHFIKSIARNDAGGQWISGLFVGGVSESDESKNDGGEERGYFFHGGFWDLVWLVG